MVRCADCGFLAVRNKQTRELLEVEKEKRDKWEVKSEHHAELQFHDEIPACFVQATSFVKELGQSTNRDSVLQAIHKERECPRSTPWIQGFTPKEHKQMVSDTELRKLQTEQRENDRRWREEQRQRDLAWQLSQKRWDRGWSMFLALLAALVGYLFASK